MNYQIGAKVQDNDGRIGEIAKINYDYLGDGAWILIIWPDGFDNFLTIKRSKEDGIKLIDDCPMFFPCHIVE